MRLYRSFVMTLGLALLADGVAVASDNHILPVWNPPGQMVLFMVHCYSGPCDEIEVFDSNGNTVKSETFLDVPEHGSV